MTLVKPLCADSEQGHLTTARESITPPTLLIGGGAIYAEHFGFKECPFNSTPDPSFFYASNDCQETLVLLEAAIKTKNAFATVTGDAGTGKSTLLRRLVSDTSGRTVFVPLIHPGLKFSELMHGLIKHCGLGGFSGDEQTLAQHFRSYLCEQFAKGFSFAIMIDEAQALSDDILEQLRLLYVNCEKTMPVVLVGQASLESRLKNANLRAVSDCITIRRKLSPLRDSDVSGYLNYRLEHAGYHGGGLFQHRAIGRIIEFSRGIPRLINILCDNALLQTFRAESNIVSADTINQVGNQMGLLERPRCRTEQRNTKFTNNPPWAPPLADDKDVAPSAYSQSAVEIIHQQAAEDAVPTDSVEVSDSNEGAHTDGRQRQIRFSVDSSTLNSFRSQRRKFKPTSVAVGGLVILALSTWGLVTLDSRHRDLATLDVRRALTERPNNSTTGALAITNEPRSQTQPRSSSHKPSPPLSEPIDQATVAAANSEIALISKMVPRPSTEIYRVTAPVLLRSRPTADAEIISTIEPGTRVSLARVSNEYFAVHAFADPKISGFVHREDGFFERTQ